MTAKINTSEGEKEYYDNVGIVEVLGSNENPLQDGVWSPGTGLKFSREDHVHPTLAGDAPALMDNLAAAGESPYFSRIDHVHPKDTSKADKLQMDWVTVDLTNNWIEYNATDFPVGFIKDSMGFVHLCGIISGGVQGSVAFTLPAGYRPLKEKIRATVSNYLPACVTVDADGLVKVAKMETGQWVALDDVTPIPTF